MGDCPWYVHTVIVLVQLAIGSLHKTPNIHEGKDGLEDKLFDNAHDNAPQHGRQHGTKGDPMLLAPTMKDHSRHIPSMDSCARNLGASRMDGCILLHH
jgi:hypothetical protein